jgi:hypothetical protein
MEDLLVFINLVCLVITIMIVWFKTNAFVEYCSLFNFKKLLFGYDSGSDNLTFPQYLYIKSRTLFSSSIFRFLVALITCPLCLGFWLSVIAATIYGSILLFPSFYIFVLIGYSLTDRVIG